MPAAQLTSTGLDALPPPEMAGKAAQVGLIGAKDANLNDYVTAKALDSLFGAIAEEEVAIRKDPLGQTSSLVKKVFGALQH